MVLRLLTINMMMLMKTSTAMLLMPMKMLAKKMHIPLSLFPPDRNGLRNLEEIRKLKAAVWAALQKEMLHNPPMTPTKGDVSTLSLLVNKRMALR